MLALVLLLTTSGLAAATNPGLGVRVTQKGIDYANSIAQQALKSELYTIKAPDQGGKDHGASWDLKNINIKEVNPPTSRIRLNPGIDGFQWELSGLVIKIKADWKVKYKKAFFKVSKSGGIDLELKKISLSVGIHLGADSNGRPSLSTSQDLCSASIGDADLHFHGTGGLGKVLDFFDGPLERKIKQEIQKQLCPAATNLINQNGNKAMKQLKVTVPVLNNFILDYRLTEAPFVAGSYLDLADKGMFYWKDDEQTPPYTPQTIDRSDGTNDRMLYLWASDYVPNTFSYATHNHNFFDIDVDLENIEGMDKSYLETTCIGLCVGTVFPKLAQKFPNSRVNKVHINVTSPPKTSIESNGVHLHVPAIMKLYAESQEQPQAFLLSLNVTLDVTANPSVVQERIRGNVTEYRYTVEVLKSKIGNVDPDSLDLILDLLTETVLVPKVNELGTNGFDLPMTGCVTFTNKKVKLLQGSMMIGTDIIYNNA